MSEKAIEAATLADQIEKRIRTIPSANSGYISFRQQTLGDILDHELLRFIALEAADVAKAALPPLRAREEIARIIWKTTFHSEPDDHQLHHSVNGKECLRIADALSLPAVQGEGRVPELLAALTDANAGNVELLERVRLLNDENFKLQERLTALSSTPPAPAHKCDAEDGYPCSICGAWENAPAPAPEGEWREISSAPKDGRDIWLWKAGWENAAVGGWINKSCMNHSRGVWMLYGGLLVEPTHWQPYHRPAPPVAEPVSHKQGEKS